MSKQYPGGLITKTPVVPNSISAPGIWSLSDQAEAQSTNTWPFPRDPQFNYVTMLLHGDGAAGAVPTTGAGAGTSATLANFNADASTNAFNLAINGDARSNNFTPYQGNGYYSNFFDGTGDYLSIADNAALDLSTGDFTIECWVFPTNAISDVDGVISKRSTSTFDGGDWRIAYNSANTAFGLAAGSNSTDRLTPTITLNAWNHIAFVRESGTLSCYANGTRGANLTWTTNLDNAQPLLIGLNVTGYDFPGYISNVRIVKGTAVYSGATYTVPTTPLTAITNTSLLTCQSNRFIDNSTNAFTVTKVGDTAVAPASPFTLPTGLTTYGSGYFDGTGDTLTSSTTQIIPTGSFTVECWAYVTGASNNQKFVSQGVSSGVGRFSLGIEAGNWWVQLNDDWVQAGTPVRRQWNYLAATYNGSTLTLYLNGVSLGSAAVVSNAQNSILTVGTDWLGYIVTGYISDIRISNTVRSISVPTAPYTSDANTRLLTTQFNGGGNNSGFKDSSQNNFVITRNGNTTQGTFAPYGSNWSNYFNGTDATLYFSNSSNFAFGTGSFTIEFWINGPLNNDKFILGGRDAIGGMHITTGGSGSTAGVLRYVGTSTIVSSNVITDNTWHHCAIVRNGSSNITLYVDGVSVGTGTDTNNYAAASGTWYIARNDLGASNFLNGYLSNLRIVKGTAVYTSAFTPSTTPLTAISGTSLLTCADNRFVDDSTNNLAITATGTPSVQRFSPFAPLTVYNPATYGGSAYFDGSGDTLTCTGTLPATADFTLSLWVYPTSLAGYAVAIQQSGSGNTFYLYLGYADGKTDIQVGSTNYNDYTAGVYKANQWNYVQVVKASSAYSFYVNGTALSVTSSTGNIGTTSIASGTLTVNYNTGCYITDVRIVNTALSNSVPTSPLTAVSGTTMLLSMQNGAIFDNAMINNLETVGNATISTNVVKYGRASIAFDGTGDYLLGPSTPNMSFGAGDFTTEAWVYRTASPGNNQTIFQKGRTADSNLEFTMLLSGSNFLSCFYTTDGSTAVQPFSSTTAIPLNTWTHIALTRSGSTWRCFVNGTLEATTTAAVTLYTGTGLISSGSNPIGDNPFTGYIDDLRITKGYCRYTATFTPPTAAFPNG